ncbi:MAG: TIGR00266 family protein [Nitrososphaerota archaeon]|nr:TIGR00266 family protein [Aigarchaeota archaeon]MDW8076338.1 TIGR00266 family protein [Nitrososphaerota archaeon]
MVSWTIDNRPSYTVLKVKLESGDSVTSEGGAMMLMRGDVEVKTYTGGIRDAVLRKLVGGESLFLNTFSTRTNGEVWLVPRMPGDVEYIPLNNEGYFVQDTSYLAHHGDIKISVGWRGIRGVLAEGQFVWLNVKGTGGVWVNSFGAIEKVELQPHERISVDNLHFVAMPENTKWSVRKFGGWKSFLLGGEGLVFDVEGPAKIYLQTRVLPLFAELLAPYLSRQK